MQIAGLARSTYYYHRARLRQPPVDRTPALVAAIETVFLASHRRYGCRKVHRALQRQGWRVAVKTVLTLMRQRGLRCPIRRRRRYPPAPGTVAMVAPNRLDRDFTASAPNQKWVTDLTRITVGGAVVWVAPIMDLFDRQIIAWRTGASPTLDLTTGVLRDALATLRPHETPLVHTDQGFHYQHRTWHALLAAAGASASMSRKGTCLDNAVIESFFGHLKEELVHHASYPDLPTFMIALDAYFTWYNTERISMALGGMSPVAFRASRLAASP